jgi:hypothetical protein
MFGHSVIVITSILAAARFARKNLRDMDLVETLTACGILLASEGSPVPTILQEEC